MDVVVELGLQVVDTSRFLWKEELCPRSLCTSNLQPLYLPYLHKVLGYHPALGVTAWKFVKMRHWTI